MASLVAVVRHFYCVLGDGGPHIASSVDSSSRSVGCQVSSVRAKMELTYGQRDAIRHALPIVPDLGMPGLISLCFVPHHRIVMRDAAGQETKFTVCFGCDEVQLADGNIFMTPFLWRSSLRRLFTEHGIPVRDLREYSKPDLLNTGGP
jgi:hypothetical protein